MNKAYTEAEKGLREAKRSETEAKRGKSKASCAVDYRPAKSWRLGRSWLIKLQTKGE